MPVKFSYIYTKEELENHLIKINKISNDVLREFPLDKEIQIDITEFSPEHRRFLKNVSGINFPTFPLNENVYYPCIITAYEFWDYYTGDFYNGNAILNSRKLYRIGISTKLPPNQNDYYMKYMYFDIDRLRTKIKPE